MKIKPLAIAATLAAAALFLSACSGVADRDYDAGEERTAPERTDSAPAEEKPTPPAPGPEEGTREAPLPYGFNLTVYQGVDSNVIWNVQVNQPAVVTGEIAGANQFNAPPQPGFDYVSIPAHIVWNGTEPITPWVDFQYGLDVAFVSTDGVTYEEEFVVMPDGWSTLMDVADLYQGGAADFVTIVQVPSGATGTVRVTVGPEFTAFWG